MSPLRVHYFQHVPFEGLGCIEEWVEHHHYTLSHTRFFTDDPLPPPGDIDLLIIMGGPMGVYETRQYPWLEKEIAFIREAIGMDKKVLGICLGSQLIAAALGASVYPAKEKEIGWYPVYPTALSHSKGSIYSIIKTASRVFHWHGDTFDLPAGAVNHAYSDACCHQLYTVGNNVTGIQFHFEATDESIRQMLEHGEQELIPSPSVQSKETILQQTGHTPKANRAMTALLDNIVGN